MGPGGKVKLLRSFSDRAGLVRLFLTAGAEPNILKAAKSSLPAVRSGVASYTRFCELLDRRLLPPTEDAVQLRSATFNPGRTFNQYLAHLKKAIILRNHSLAWLTPRDPDRWERPQECPGPQL